MSPDRRPTPKDLSEVVYQIITTPGRDLRMNAQQIICDFLSQKFSLAMLQHPECELVLEELFKQCIFPLTREVKNEEE
jgi:hypothetical protein